MKRADLLLIILILTLSLLQFAVFSAWTLGGVAPQIFVVLTFFLFQKRDETYLWWFIWLYFFFYDLLTASRLPTLNGLFFLLLIYLFRLVRARLLKNYFLSSLLFFFLITAAHFFLSGFYYSLTRLFSQFILNGLFLALLYFPLGAVYRYLQGEKSVQLDLRI